MPRTVCPRCGGILYIVYMEPNIYEIEDIEDGRIDIGDYCGQDGCIEPIMHHIECNNCDAYWTILSDLEDSLF
jgi:hypothetical protein